MKLKLKNKDISFIEWSLESWKPMFNKKGRKISKKILKKLDK